MPTKKKDDPAERVNKKKVLKAKAKPHSPKSGRKKLKKDRKSKHADVAKASASAKRRRKQ